MDSSPAHADRSFAPILSDPARRKLKKAFAALFLGFVVLGLARFLYSFAIPVEELNRMHSSWVSQVSDLENISYKRVAMTNLAQLGLTAEQALAQGNVAQLQVFEKTGHVSSTTSAFDEDLKTLLGAVAARKGQIKYEKMDGLAPRRTVVLALSVGSEAFEDTLAQLRSIGNLESASVTKRDMTDTFRSLLAKRDALCQYQEALAKLRQAQGSVEEFIKLEEKIRSLQEEIHAQSIQLGDFTQKESFCNIACALAEREKARAYSLGSRFADAILWSIEWYFLACLGVAALLLIGLSLRWLRE